MGKVKLFFLFLSFFIVFKLNASPVPDSLITEKGRFDKWRVYELKESGLIGGNPKILYRLTEPGDTVKGNKPYIPDEEDIFSPCNVMANILGVIKGSNSVVPEKRGDGYCARLQVIMEQVKVLGLINLDVIVQGTIISGDFKEPVRDTKGPYRKVNFGIPFTGRPTALQYDYKAISRNPVIRATGLSSVRKFDREDYPYIAVMLQHREEDAEGNITAKRVGSAFKLINRDVPFWVNGEMLKIHYGDISKEQWFHEKIDLKNKDIKFYARNSKGELTVIREEGWDSEGAEPTHVIIWISASCEEAFYGGLGNTLWIDNVKFVY